MGAFRRLTAAGIRLALLLALAAGTLAAPAFAQNSAGQGTGFSMTPPIPADGGKGDGAKGNPPPVSIPMTLPPGGASGSPPASAPSFADEAPVAAPARTLAVPAMPQLQPSTSSSPFNMPGGISPSPAGPAPARPAPTRPAAAPDWVPAPPASTAQLPPLEPVAPPPVAPPPVAAPATPLPAPGFALPPAPSAPPSTANPFQMVPGQPAPAPAPLATTATPAAPRSPDRYIIPQRRMIFAGEVASRSWVIYATQEEANRASSFLLSYLSAVVVMPETSRIRVSLNGQPVVERAIAASQEPAHVEVPLQRGTLRPGANIVRIDVVQRHRTDCAVTATYELWTEINNEGTGISFAGGRPPLSGGLEDLASVGVDASGVTPIRVVTPGPIEGGGSARVLRVVQGLAVRGQFPNPSITVGEGQSGATPKGGLTVVVGTASELPRLMASVPNEARGRPITTLIEDDRLGAPTLVISGPTPADVDRAIDRLNAISIPQDDAVSTSTVFAPDAPMFTGSRAIRLADLGVSTQEFSGRRFRIEFQVALPADFYAQAYGNATLLVDAAFTAAVRPGSHLDVYVNEQIASNLPITTSGGGLLQKEPMQIPLRNFRPGVNRLWLEVVLDTESDARCLPGATLPAEDRFVLFDSTEFTMDSFARIGRLPDLAAFAATAFPYNLDDNPLAVVLARQDSATLAAAGTLISRLALANGAPLAIDASPASATLGDRNTIFVGGIDFISPGILEQVGISENVRSKWVVPAGSEDPKAIAGGDDYDNVLQRFRQRQIGEETPPPASLREGESENTPEIYQRWRENVQGRNNVYGLLERFEGWLQSTFAISFDSLRIQEGRRSSFEPPPRTSVLMAQAMNPSGSSAWTMVAGRTSEALAAGMIRFTSDGVWNRVGGQAVAYQVASGSIERRDIRSFQFIVTQPLSLGNFRMIAANWLSINIVPYALMLLAAGTLLGITTALLLRRLGRPT
ncbi:cellulose biosynthesis cyclic di-GMP-binding regulatory protein BcsB [Ancylobacter sp. TS-1]|uniref:cellulose biosynthesis cyclic di-GMP-binding regulatory protein BcsB n=1 Tax=Ancylobacter sp. TS-1 TaxID=1850374 RepID=UPI001391CC9D|nr:cellulose biosynthesis cyclic di-GMP-binding regulatory protein BcsB [Ancylobacter sp. TS-1]